jgi:hypothetical protein
VKDIKTGAIAETNVQENYIRRFFGRQLQTFGGRLSAEHLNGLVGKDSFNAEMDARFVVNDQ